MKKVVDKLKTPCYSVDNKNKTAKNKGTKKEEVPERETK